MGVRAANSLVPCSQLRTGMLVPYRGDRTECYRIGYVRPSTETSVSFLRKAAAGGNVAWAASSVLLSDLPQRRASGAGEERKRRHKLLDISRFGRNH